jgi:hypothetical protein
VRAKLLRTVVLGSVLGGSYALYPYCLAGPILCPFRLMTGLPCPTCGLTRAFCFVAHGRVSESLAFHWFGVPLFLLALVCFIASVWDLVARRDVVGRWWGRFDRRPEAWVWGIAAFQTVRVAWLFLSGQALSLMMRDSVPLSLLRTMGLI